MASMLAGGWLGCNPLLGNEVGDLAPTKGQPTSAEGSVEEASLEDGEARDAVAADRDANLNRDADSSGDDAAIRHPCNETRSDPFNCGACGHDCLGGLCSAGKCDPLVIADEPGEPREIAVDDAYVYWTNRGASSVRRAPLRGGLATTIYAGSPEAPLGDGLVRNGNDIYFSIKVPAGGVFKCPISGCGNAGPEPVIATVDSPEFIAIVGNVLLVSEHIFNGRIGRCTLPCAGGLAFAEARESFPGFIAAEGDATYWSTILQSPGNLRAIFGTGPARTLVAQDSVAQIAIQGAEVFFALRGSGIRATARDGGVVRRLFESTTPTERFAIDGSDVYFSNPAVTGGRILRCPLAGCAIPTAVASFQANPFAVVTDASSLLWANRGDGQTGRIMRLAK